ncbi:MAG: DUF805 domain-containing protein [Bacillota bacterium]|nr:DUF805 domain-containing protein [Bacillota bacterium]
MDFFGAVKTVFSKYAVFNGRARRSEYWWFALFNFIVTAILSFIWGIIFGTDSTNILTTIYSLAVFLPGLAVSVRRMHDIGKSGAWILIGFIPIVGTILMIIWCAQDSQPGSNMYGPNPK